MWRLVAVLVFAVLLTVPAAAAAAAAAGPTDGQIAVVVRANGARLVTLNPDGTGLRTLWSAPLASDRVSEPAWSPDGNRIAFVYSHVPDGTNIVVYDLAANTAQSLLEAVAPPDTVAHPAWTPDGTHIAYMRGQSAWTIAPGSDPQPLPVTLPASLDDADWAPDATAVALAGGRALTVASLTPPGADRTLVAADVAGGLAWSPDGTRIVFAKTDGSLQVVPAAGGDVTPLTAPDAVSRDGVPAWSPVGARLAFTHGKELRLTDDDGSDPRALLSGDLADPAWQPCTAGVTDTCVSVTPAPDTHPPSAPVCQAETVTTQAGQPVDLPAPVCTDPAGLPLTFADVKGPEHGTLGRADAAGHRRYVPAGGFSGEDGLVYVASNGGAQSAPTRVTIYVVPRPAPMTAPAGVRRAPYLNARARPRLDRRGRVTLIAGCDQACTLSLTLTARLRSGHQVTSRVLRRGAVGGRDLTLRFALHRPVPKLRRVRMAWITGTVTGPSGDGRSVKLPVIVPR